MTTHAFQRVRVDPSLRDPFEALASGVAFEDVGRGRQGNHLVDVDDAGRIPIVRTTTRYARPAHVFSPAHRALASAIARAAGEPVPVFNNVLIEIYDRTYYKMGFHSDQALDLEPGSWIALYSCYEHPEMRSGLRTLKVKDKTTNEETTIVLEHGTAVLFSVETNTRFVHKIVLDPPPKQHPKEPDNRWLGLTFRRSGTWIRFDTEGTPRFPDGAPLTLADDQQQQRTFFKLRGQENRNMDFSYPRLDITISPADLLLPEPEGSSATALRAEEGAEAPGRS